MAINWSKYGIEEQSSGGINWNKYVDTDEYKLKDRIESGKLPSFDVTDSPLARQAQTTTSQIMYDEPAGPPNPTLPGRRLPVIGPVLRGLDYVASNPVSEAIAEYTVPDQPMMRDGEITGTNARDRFLRQSGQEEATGVPKFLGQASAPFFVPGAGLGAGTTLRNSAEALTSRLSPGLGRTAAREAAIGAPIGFGSEYAQGQGDLGQAAISGAIGAAGGAALPALGAGVRAASSSAGRGLTQAVDRPSLGTAVDDFMKRINASETPAPTGRITQEIPGPAYSRAQQLADNVRFREEPTMARVGTRSNPFAQKLDELFTAARQEQLPPGREREALEDLWSRMAGPDDPGLDELIDLGTPTLQDMQRRTPTRDLLSRAKETQRVREVAGVPLPVKSEADRFLTAPVRQVDEALQPPRSTVREAAQSLRKEPDSLKSEVMPEPQSVDDILTVKEPRIRDRVYTYLDDAEKAAKERIASRRNRLSSTPIDEYADYSIVAAAKIGKGTIKLADLTEQMVKEYGEDIRGKMPAIYRRAQVQMKDAERRATKQAQEAREFNAQDLGDGDTFRGKVSRDVSRKSVPFSQRYEKIRTALTDDLAPLEGLEKRVRGQVNSAESSLYKSARLYRGMPAKANQIVVDRLSPIVNDIEKAGFTSKDLGDYALAVHAKDVNARDIKSGFTNREIENVVQKFGTPQMEEARKALVKVGDDMLNELAEAGVVSRENMELLRQRYPNYIPLFRHMDDDKVEIGRGISDALANVTSPIKVLKGSERQVVDPLENMVKNIFQSVNASERNKVAKQLAKLSDDELQSKMIRKLGENEDAGSKNIVSVVEDGNKVRYEVEPMLIRKLDEQEQVGRKNVVSVLQDGKKVQYEVEPEVYKAMLNLDQESSNMLIKALQAPASVLRAGATLTPEFSLRNPMRDVLQAFVTSNSGFNPIVDFPVGIIQSIKKGDLYKQWVRDMGDFGNVVSMDRDAHREALTKVLGEPAGKKFVNVVTGKSLLNILRAIADTSEAATKVGEYRAALRQGQTPQEAAYRSRDIMDFSRAGTGIRQANKVVAFLNANIQGKSKLLRAIKANPVGVGARAFAAVTVPTIGVFAAQKYLANDEQKRIIDDSPAWLTDSFWLLPVPGTDQVARIPKPFDLAAIFSNAPERALKYVYNNDEEAFDKFISKSLSDMALPAQISGLLPFVEGMANYSFFRQGDIIPMGEAGREYKDQFDINTTTTAKLLAAGTNLLTRGEGAFKNFSSPRIMDNTIKGLTAGLGTYATSAVDILLDKLNVTDNPVKPDKGPAQKPLAKAFLVNPLQSGKATEKLYDAKDKLSREKSSAKLNELKFDPAKEKELKFITKQTDNMSDFTKKIRETEKDRTLSPQEKRRLIDEYTRERSRIAADAAKQLQKR